MNQTKIRGLDRLKLGKWLESQADLNLAPPYDYRLIAAGGSNLTYEITGADGNSVALRRPPEYSGLATAHDMGREWRVIKALGNSLIPVPECLAYCEDLDIIGAPFYLMSFEGGVILRDAETAPNITKAEALTATNSLVDTQTAMHKLDLEQAGLADLGKHQDYVGRQLKRWKRQVDDGGVREVGLHTELYELLMACKPEETAPPGLVHGDYRFDNCVLNQNWEIKAVLDWELCTIGNPIADFVWSLQYWADPGDDMEWIPNSPTLAPAFINRDAYKDLYADKSGFSLSDFNYYQIFSWWKQASIIEGAYARRLAGASGGLEGSGDSSDIAQRVDTMLEYAKNMAKGVLM